MHFDEAIQDFNATEVLKDWLVVLVNANVKLSDLTDDQMCAVKSLLNDSHSEVWGKCVPHGDL